MIIEKSDFDNGYQMDADICIIGGGPAAISIALELKNSKKKIVILSGGKWKQTVFNQDLNKGLVAPGSSHESLDEGRRRQLGGGTAVWGGRCLPFEPIDFIKRDWIDDSGWPITYEDMKPYYERAAVLTRIGKNKFSVDENKDDKEIIPGMDSEYIVSTSIERWSPPVNFAKEYREDLDNAENIFFYVDAHALNLNTGEKQNTISYAEAYLNGKRFKVAASQFILAAGGLENPRILLSSQNQHHPSGIGNHNDNVGRYYMAHIIGNYAELKLNDPRSIITGYERDTESIYYRRRWWLTEKAQKELKLVNTIFYLDNPYEAHGHYQPLYSSLVIAKSIRSIARQRTFYGIREEIKKTSPQIFKHTPNVLLKGWKQLPDIVTKFLKRFPERRIPSILPSEKTGYWGVLFQTEQTPRRDSRVTVSKQEFDAIGTPRLVADIRFNSEDFESIVRSHNLFISRFEKSGAGSYIYSEEGLRSYLENIINSFHSNAHHIGTTRMSSTESKGVVDSNSKVFGVKNLFIAGSSVFPTGGHANPTLTIVAQSLRLADHIKMN